MNELRDIYINSKDCASMKTGKFKTLKIFTFKLQGKMFSFILKLI